MFIVVFWGHHIILETEPNHDTSQGDTNRNKGLLIVHPLFTSVVNPTNNGDDYSYNFIINF